MFNKKLIRLAQWPPSEFVLSVKKKTVKFVDVSDAAELCVEVCMRVTQQTYAINFKLEFKKFH